MGFLDIFKTKKEKEVINLVDAPEWIKNKQEELEKSENNIINIIKDRILQLGEELKSEIIVLENKDLSADKRAKEKIKRIVKENVLQYISRLEKLIKSLKEIETRSVHEMNEEIDRALTNFESGAKLNYEKATFLVGKEMAATKNSIKNFYKDLEKIVGVNSETLRNIKKVEEIDLKLKEINQNDKLNKENLIIKKEVTTSFNLLNEKKESLEKKIEEFKKSQEYSRILDKEKQFEDKKTEFEKKLKELKESIDLKDLAQIFHSNEKEMLLIKKYRDNFEGTFFVDNGNGLLDLIGASKKSIDPQEMKDKINEILKFQVELDHNSPKENRLDQMNLDLKELGQKIAENEIELTKTIKKEDKFVSRLKELKKELKEKIEEIGIEVI